MWGAGILPRATKTHSITYDGLVVQEPLSDNFRCNECTRFARPPREICTSTLFPDAAPRVARRCDVPPQKHVCQCQGVFFETCTRVFFLYIIFYFVFISWVVVEGHNRVHGRFVQGTLTTCIRSTIYVRTCDTYIGLPIKADSSGLL